MLRAIRVKLSRDRAIAKRHSLTQLAAEGEGKHLPTRIYRVIVCRNYAKFKDLSAPTDSDRYSGDRVRVPRKNQPLRL